MELNLDASEFSSKITGIVQCRQVNLSSTVSVLCAGSLVNNDLVADSILDGTLARERIVLY